MYTEELYIALFLILRRCDTRFDTSRHQWEHLLLVVDEFEQRTPAHQCAFTAHAPFTVILCAGVTI